MQKNIGLIGAGKIGQMRAATILKSPKTKLVGICDLDRAAAEAVAGGAPIFERAEDLLDQPLDAVVVSTPAHTRAPLILQAIGKGLTRPVAEEPARAIGRREREKEQNKQS